MAEATKLPKDVIERQSRGRKARDEKAPLRQICWQFYRDEQYNFLEAGQVWDQRQVAKDRLEPEEYRNRVWQTRNIIRPIVEAKVSAASQRVPGYEINPSTNDSEDWSASDLSRKVAYAGFDQWKVRKAIQEAILYALVARDAFIYPYWDSQVGPYYPVQAESAMGALVAEVKGEDEKYVGIGDVRLRVLGRSHVAWEPGLDYEESPWFSIEYARPIDILKREPDYIGGDLKADAETKRVMGSRRQESDNLVIVSEFFERPCPSYPEGRRYISANDHIIFPPEDRYPLEDSQGEVVDEPLLHRLSYLLDPDQDDNLGLVETMLDTQRTFNDCNNKSLEYKNLGLLLQMLSPEGSVKTRITSTPGANFEYEPNPYGEKPEWREPPNPQILAQLQELADRAKADLGFLAHANEIPSQVESGVGLQTLIERDQLAWQRFLGDLADVHARVMRDCLTHVQRHYDEPRLMTFRGRTGWENLEDFRGADIRHQTDVRVLPGSLEPMTRAAIEQRIQNVLQMFPGYWAPEIVLSALAGGTAEKLIEDYELDVRRANNVIKKIKAGPEILMGTSQPRPGMPGEVDEMGMPIPIMPDWMPRPGIDNLGVHKAVLGSWMKTDEWDLLDFEMKRAGTSYYGALISLEQFQAMQQQQATAAQAESVGMDNAAGGGEKVMPSMPAVQGNGR